MHGDHHPHPAVSVGDPGVWLPRSPLSRYPSARIGALAPSLQPPPSSEKPAPHPEPPKLPYSLPEGCGVSPARGHSPLIRRIPVDRLQAEPRHQPQNAEQQQGPDSHAPRPRTRGPHDPAKAWGGRGTNSPKVAHPPAVPASAAPATRPRPPRWRPPPCSHADPLPALPAPLPRSAQPARALPGAACRRPTPPAHAPAPRDRSAGLSGGLGRPGAGRGRHGAPHEGAREGREPEPQPRRD